MHESPKCLVVIRRTLQLCIMMGCRAIPDVEDKFVPFATTLSQILIGNIFEENFGYEEFFVLFTE